MLTHITIRDFTIVENLSLDLYKGMTALTGETGAGKSILIDAISLAIGERASPSTVRHGKARAEVCLEFDIGQLSVVQNWLTQYELDADNECILRRVISKEGRSRAFINNHPVPVQRLKEIGALLIDIHGQHAQHALLNPSNHTRIIDEFGEHHSLCQQVKKAYKHWQQTFSSLNALKESTASRHQRIQFLQFQVNELTELDLGEQEWPNLLAEQKRLSNSEQLAHETQTALDVLKDNPEHNVLSLLNKATLLLRNTSKLDNSLDTALEMLKNSEIQIQEAYYDIQSFEEKYTCDPARLAEVEQRLATVHALARKYHIEADQLNELKQSLDNELHDLQGSEETCQQLEEELAAQEAAYHVLADKLSTKRQKASKQLTKIISQHLKNLGLPNGQFSINLTTKSEERSISATGNETAQFLVSMNPGQPQQPLHKVASGGELSRVSLAIEVANSQRSLKPVMIFDEVDVGIGGGVAEMVGHCLGELGKHAQVLCITHLAQVAAKATQHLVVSKVMQNKATATQIETLTPKQKIDELARMLGGMKITEKTRQHAKEMLEGH